jgi:uncharacterized metal-binding protein
MLEFAVVCFSSAIFRVYSGCCNVCSDSQSTLFTAGLSLADFRVIHNSEQFCAGNVCYWAAVGRRSKGQDR